jgi:predicted lipoprotein with Yx(FWY)xxD motif
MKRPALVADWAAGAALLAAVSLATALVTGCSSGHGNSSANVSHAPASAQAAESPANTDSATAMPTGPATVSVASSKLGKILVGTDQHALYLFEGDKTSKSTCTGTCAAAWPPMTTQGTPKAGTGATALRLGTTQRTDGTTQVTVNGHPVYYFAGDVKAGDTLGQELNQFGAMWWALDASGNAITKGGASGSPSASPSESASASPSESPSEGQSGSESENDSDSDSQSGSENQSGNDQSGSENQGDSDSDSQSGSGSGSENMSGSGN